MEIFHPNNTQELADLLNTHPMAIVDLFSNDCPPCNRFAPLFENAAQQHPSIAFVKIHRQEFRDLAESFHIFSSPTVLFFHRNTLQDKRLAGVIQESDFQSEIERLLQQESA